MAFQIIRQLTLCLLGGCGLPAVIYNMHNPLNTPLQMTKLRIHGCKASDHPRGGPAMDDEIWPDITLLPMAINLVSSMTFAVWVWTWIADSTVAPSSFV